jgi:hypothetical protein
MTAQSVIQSPSPRKTRQRSTNKSKFLSLNPLKFKDAVATILQLKPEAKLKKD